MGKDRFETGRPSQCGQWVGGCLISFCLMDKVTVNYIFIVWFISQGVIRKTDLALFTHIDKTQKNFMKYRDTRKHYMSNNRALNVFSGTFFFIEEYE